MAQRALEQLFSFVRKGFSELGLTLTPEMRDLQMLAHVSRTTCGGSTREVFKQAWYEYFGSHLTEIGLDTHMDSYLDTDQLPYWVRDYLRKNANTPLSDPFHLPPHRMP